ncbi:MAG TPA: zinc-ribbon domain-containing protein [Thermoplasmata archaeon]
MICPSCKAEIPDKSTFCMSCGRPLTAEGVDIILPPEGSHTEGRATIYLMLAIMCLFFGLFLLIPGYFIGLGMLVPAVCLTVAGVILLLARYYILRRYAERVEKLRRESNIKLKCRYCGALTPEGVGKCGSCGAPL